MQGTRLGPPACFANLTRPGPAKHAEEGGDRSVIRKTLHQAAHLIPANGPRA